MQHQHRAPPPTPPPPTVNAAATHHHHHSPAAMQTPPLPATTSTAIPPATPLTPATTSTLSPTVAITTSSRCHPTKATAATPHHLYPVNPADHTSISTTAAAITALSPPSPTADTHIIVGHHHYRHTPHATTPSSQPPRLSRLN
nr:hypothetical protein [Tanacetum cinerariifolium]